MKHASLRTIAYLALLLIACTDGPVDPQPVTECEGTGVLHTGRIESETWRAAASPHYFNDTVLVTGQLFIEAGALVCARPGALLLVSGPVSATAALIADGTAERPVLFKPDASSERWQGIMAGATPGGPDNTGAINLRHVRMEAADNVGAMLRGQVDIADSHFRRTDIHFTRTLLNSVVDTGDVSSTGGHFDDNIIRGGTLSLNYRGAAGSSPIHLSGGRIENSPDVGLTVGTHQGMPPDITADQPLRIVGSRGNPVQAYRNVFQAIWPTREAQDSLLGNANDTLLIWDSQYRAAAPGHLVVRRELPWKVTVGPLSLVYYFHVNTLTIEPGGSVQLFADLRVIERITALGTASAPIRMIGPATIYLVGAAQGEFENVIFDDVDVVRVAQ